MSIDPRLLERRQTVAEENAQRSMSLLLRFMTAALIVGGLFWLALSPWLSVARVRTAGIVSSGAHASLAEHNVVVGTPMILLRTGEAESALKADPWIADASVRRDWPDEVLVRVIERVPVIWVQSAEGWSWRAVDGVALPGPDGPEESSPRLIASAMLESELDGSLLVRGAAEFVVSLPDALRPGLTLELEDAELWADVEGYRVRLGRPVDMGAKALTLGTLMGEEIPEGSTVILVAPTHPAIALPGDPPDAPLEVPPETGDGEDGDQEGTDDG